MVIEAGKKDMGSLIAELEEALVKPPSPTPEIIAEWRGHRKRLGPFKWLDYMRCGDRTVIAHWLAYQAYLLYGDLLKDYDKAEKPAASPPRADS